MLELRLTDTARLRLLEQRDAEELYALIAAERERLACWLPWAPGQTLEATQSFIARTRRQLADEDGLNTVIEVDGRLAGMVGLHGVSWAHGATSIGYWLGSAYEGRGLITRAVAAYTDHAFRAWDLRRMELRAAVDNRRSRAVAERLGFTLEGVAREAELVGGRWLDLAVYVMLAPDWRARG